MFYRPTWAEVNLKNIAYNINSIRKFISPKTRILATVKADAYGHGIIPVCRKLVSLGIDFFGVATIDEALVLRKAGIKSDILILGGVFPNDADIIIKYNLAQTVFTKELALALNRAAGRHKKKARVHIKIDTGMGRLGIWHTEALAFIRQITKLKFLKLEGVFTHMPCADTDDNFTKEQISAFGDLLREFKECGIYIPLAHMANSVGALNFKESRFNLIRPGIIIYGLRPKERLPIKLRPVLSLKTKIIYLKKIPKGRSVSYGRTFIAPKPTVIATLPIGYGDGYPRLLSNKAEVLIRGVRAKIVGRVCMDQIMVDVSHIPNVRIGDTAILIGAGKNNIIRAEELAKLSHTISYEIACGIGSRVPRVYKD